MNVAIERCKSWALNRECFSRASHTIRKDSAIVALETTVGDGLSNHFEDLLLRVLLICNVVKSKVLNFVAFVETNF
jgi:hypothetical protein